MAYAPCRPGGTISRILAPTYGSRRAGCNSTDSYT